jgi:undecaprenyl-diphosphatase
MPAVIFGLLLHDFIKDNLFQPLTVAIGLFVGGVIILIFEAKHPEPTITSLDDITPRQALGVGIAQLAALWPGVSRAGSTIIGGVLFGLDRKTAVEYSFLIAIPVMIAATGYDLLKGIMEGAVQAADFPLFATGFVTAFIAASLAVRYLVTFVQRYSFRPFGWYRIILAIVIVLVLV